MTNHYIDLRNSDCVMIIGSNAAENHPMSFKWITEAKERGAKLISVDPRFTRTSAKADIFTRIRSGTDIAFIGGMIYHVLEDMRLNPQNYNIDYVTQYTNAAYIVNAGIKLPGDDGQDGLFSGWDAANKKYDTTTWKYGNPTDPTAEAKLLSPYWADWANRGNPFPEVAWGELDDNCVLKLLWNHYKRYDKETVSEITGVPVEKLEEVYTEYARTGVKGKAGSICYAMGTTQHTHGTQNIRAYAILQLLLANMGVAGGGINALRGTSNVQGSTDMCLLSHILPGYLKVPSDADRDTTLAGYLGRVTPGNITPPAALEGANPVNWWQHTPKYAVSLLKAWWPTTDHNTSYSYLPKVKSGVNYTHISMFEAMAEGDIDGLWIWGQNPAAAGPDSNSEREALGSLDWLVSVDIWMNETAEFWRRPGVDPAGIDTEVFLLPAAASYEKQGSISNSGRWAQWRYKAVDAPGEAMPDLEIMSQVMSKISELYEADTSAPVREPILELDWSYGDEPDADEVAKEVNGRALEAFTVGTRTYAAGELIDSFVHLQDDGKTASGNWLYCNQYTEAAGNKMQRRNPVDNSAKGVGLYSNWSWCWPFNRRIIYNRASVDLNGNPWDTEHPVTSWEGSAWAPQGDLTDKKGGDVLDGGWPPINVADPGSKYLPFIMKPEGVARIWGFGRAEGPLPEVYEPWESPLDTNIMSGTKTNPCAYIGKWMNERGTPDKYPYVGTTYRCSEHWQTGIMTRNLPWLVELMPEMYVEMGEELAEQKNIQNGDKVIVSSARGEIEAVAIVTRRLQPLQVGGKTIHHIGAVWHFGYSGMAKGDSANILTPHVGDANTTIPEFKTFLCNVVKA